MNIVKSTLKRIIGVIYTVLCLVSAGLFVSLIGFCLTMMWATGEGWYWKLPLVFCVPLCHLIVFVFSGESASPEKVIDWCFADEPISEEEAQLKAARELDDAGYRKFKARMEEDEKAVKSFFGGK